MARIWATLIGYVFWKFLNGDDRWQNLFKNKSY